MSFLASPYSGLDAGISIVPEGADPAILYGINPSTKHCRVLASVGSEAQIEFAKDESRLFFRPSPARSLG